MESNLFSNKDLRRLIVPLFVEQFLLMFVGIADTFVVSFSSEADVSGVSLVTSFNTVLIFLFTALSSGGAVIISQYIGSKQNDTASRSAGQLLMISTLVSVGMMALIMRYAVKNETFLHIAQTRDYTFSEITGKRTFSVHNANAFLDMRDGVLAGKTGYTSQAGYCYVCAWEKEGKTFIVSLLGCGWPNHKTYKWSDTKKLLDFGDYNYEYETYWKEPQTGKILVTDGVEDGQDIGTKIYLRGKCSVTAYDREKEVLLKKGETVTCKMEIPQKVSAPVLKGEKLGRIAYYLDGKLIDFYPVYAEKSVEKISFKWYTEKVFHDFFH